MGTCLNFVRVASGCALPVRTTHFWLRQCGIALRLEYKRATDTHIHANFPQPNFEDTCLQLKARDSVDTKGPRNRLPSIFGGMLIMQFCVKLMGREATYSVERQSSV